MSNAQPPGGVPSPAAPPPISSSVREEQKNSEKWKWGKNQEIESRKAAAVRRERATTTKKTQWNPVKLSKTQ